MNNTITEMINTPERINSRLDDTETSISELKYKVVEIIEVEQKKRIKRKEDSLRDFCDNIKHINICIIGLPEGEERQKGAENIFEDIIDIIP